MKRLLVFTVLAVLLLTACDPVSVPDVSDAIPDIIPEEPKPDEKPEEKPPVENIPEETPPSDTGTEETDMLALVAGKQYTTLDPCVLGDGMPVFDIQVLKTDTGYKLNTDAGVFTIIKGEDGKYRVEEYEISVSNDGTKVIIGDAVYEGTD